MKKNQSIKNISVVASVTILTALCNHIIFKHAKKHPPIQKQNDGIRHHYYHWVCGDIHYTKAGQGAPILLIHNLDPASAGYEWEKVVPILAGSRTVYTLDLAGCGQSKKSGRIYTNFFYTQLIKDFTREVIGEKTDVAAIGYSMSFVSSACASDGDLFRKLVFIAPKAPVSIEKSENFLDQIYSLCLRIPVLGTLLYNFEFSKVLLKFKLRILDFSRKESCTPEIVDTCYYHAHLHGYQAKALFSSLLGGYLNVNISKIFENLQHKMLFIIGRNAFSGKEIMNSYRALNPSIDTVVINNTKDLIPLENHLAVANAILNFISA
jgi:pimeloyl-ACP methyl ester carboxylesterase